MEQVEFNNLPDIKFSNYFIDIENLHKEDLPNINLLIKKYPYCQALYLLASRSAIGTPSYEQVLARAAVSVPSRNVLYDFIYHPSKFKSERFKKSAPQEIAQQETIISIIDDSPAFSEKEPSEELSQEQKYTHDDEVFEEITSPVVPVDFSLSIHHQPVLEASEIENLTLDGEKYSETLITEQGFADSKAEQSTWQQQKEEEISVSEKENEKIPEYESGLAEENEAEIINKDQPGSEEEVVLHSNEEKPDGEDSTENSPVIEASLPYVENIENEEEDKEEDNFASGSDDQQTLVSSAPNLPQVLDGGNLSRYDDERLPYTFLWWLAKTRKTYQENLRPYATFSLDTTQEIKKNENDALEHQIAENIFHLHSVSEIEQKTGGTSTVAFDFMKKEHQIIEKFIKEEPQIKPPPANKIDTENKAKRSSEDSNELVSETLAKVYVEQMLFHKALEVYKKLSLKYPEKSAYFASQIKYLELKVN